MKEWRKGKVGREEPKGTKSGKGGVFYRQKYRPSARVLVRLLSTGLYQA